MRRKLADRCGGRSKVGAERGAGGTGGGGWDANGGSSVVDPERVRTDSGVARPFTGIAGEEDEE